MPTTLEELDQSIATAEQRQGLAMADIDAAIQVAESRFELTPEEVKSVQQSMPPKGFMETVAGNTTLGLGLRAANRAYVGEDYIEPEEGDFGKLGNLAAEVGSIALDPVFIGAGVGGRTLARAALGERVVGESLKRGAARAAITGAATLGAVSGAQDPLIQYREKGEVDPAQTGFAIAEGATLGAALGPASQVGEALLPRAIGEGIGRRVARAGTAVGAETATLGTGSAVAQGRLPNDEDFLHAAGIVLGMKGVGKIAELRERLKSRGPEEDARKIAEDVIGEEATAKVLEAVAAPPLETTPPKEPLKPGEAEIPPTPQTYFLNAKLAALAENEKVTRKEYMAATGKKQVEVPVADQRLAEAKAEKEKVDAAEKEVRDSGERQKADPEGVQAQAPQGEVNVVLETPAPQPVDPIPVTPAKVQGAKLRDAEQRVVEADAAYETARKALERYRKQRGYKANADPKLLQADQTYQSLKAIADAARRSRSAAEGARTKASGKGEPTTPEERAVRLPLEEIPEPVARTMQEEAAFQLANAKSDKTKVALQKIIDDAGRDVGAAVEKQKQRLLDILSGKIDQRTLPQKQWGAPQRPTDPLIDAYKAGEPLPESKHLERGAPDDASFEFGANAREGGPPPTQAGIFGQPIFDPTTGSQRDLPLAARQESNLPDVPGQIGLPPPREAGGEVVPRGTEMGIVLGPNDIPLRAIADQLSKGWNAVKAIGRAFRTRGDLPQEAFDLNVERTGELRARNKQAVFHERDLEKAIRKGYGTRSSKLHSSELEKVNAYLAGEQVDIPAATAEALNPMRAAVDANSRTTLDIYPTGEKLTAAINENMRSYLRRSYKAHHDPDWAENVPQVVKNRFKQELINEYPDKTNEQLDGIIEAILFDAKQSKNPLAFLASQGKLGSKDLSSFIKRKNLSEALRELLGEEKNPFVNYARTIQNQSQLIANHKFLTKVREAGMGKWLAEEPTPELKAQIAAEGSKGMNPLNGLYTTPEIAAEFAKWDAQPQVGPFAKWYYRALGLSKAAKTVYSHTGIIRNIPANMVIEIGQGNIALQRIGKPLDAIAADLGWSDSPPGREQLQRLVRLGVIDDNAGIRELFDIMQRAGGKSLDDLLMQPGGGAVQALKKLGPKLWQAADNLPKAWAFETERIRYARAFPEWSPEQLDQHAAGIVRNTRPTYSMLPPAVRELGRLPIGQTFIAWPAERIRNQYNTLKLIQQEMSDPRTRAIGAKRAVGTMVAGSLFYGITGAARRLLGLNAQDEKDERRFTLSYQENSPIMPIDSPKDGKVEYIDLSFTDPNAIIQKPLMALLRGEDWEDGFWNAATEFGKNFFGENLLLSALIDSARGTTAEGYALYNPQDSFWEKFKATANRMGEPFVPGSAVSLDRLRKAIGGNVEKWGRSYDPTVETIAQFGVRAQQMDVRERLMSKAGRFTDDLRDAYGIQRDKLLQPGDLSDEDLTSAVGRSGEATTRLVNEMHEDVMAAIRLGIPKSDVLEIMQAAGLSRKEIGAVLANQPQAYQADIGTIRRALKRTKATGNDAQKRLEEIRKRLATQKEAA